MSRICAHGYVWGYCPMDLPAPRLNLDRFGLPKDYATYVWVLYGRAVEDKSPARMAFLNHPDSPDPGRVVRR